MPKLSTEEFIRRAKLVHNDRYSYEQAVYINQKTPLKIFCKKCKMYFWQIPINHLQGKGCKICGIKKRVISQSLTTEEFIKRAKKIHHNKYDYSKSVYKNQNTKVKIFCKNCNSYFFQYPAKHLLGQDCKCRKSEKMHAKLMSSLNEFIQKAKKVFGDRYDYSKVNYYNNATKVCITCNKCKKDFYITPANHLRNRGCPYCKQSKGELKIENWLLIHKIKYIIQKRFIDCYDKNSLPFDFYLPDYNACIEYQGKQHYIPWRLETDTYNLEKRQLHDKIKKEYCKRNNILLIEIKYNENIENKLEEILNVK